jgi:hypothetical protein
MFEEFIKHREEAVQHVINGQSSLCEKLEVGAETVIAFAAAAALAKFGLSRLAPNVERLAPNVESVLPKLAIAAEGETPLLTSKAAASNLSIANEIKTGGIERVIPLIRSASGNEFRNLHVARELVPGKRNFVVIKGDVRQVLENLEHHNDGGKLLLREEMPDGSFSKELKTWVQHRDAEATIPFNPVAQECDLLISCHPETILDPVLRSKHVLPDSVGHLWNRFQGTQRFVPGLDKPVWFFDVFNDAYRTKYNVRTGTF